MKSFIVFCNGTEYHTASDCVLRFCEHSDGEDDDPRDRPEDDCVDFDLSKLCASMEAMAQEILSLRADVLALDSERKTTVDAQGRESRQSNEQGR